MSDSFRIGIAGLGTVGTGVVKLLQKHGTMIAARAGRPVEIVAVSARDRGKKREVSLSSYEWVEQAVALGDRKDLDAVIELIGGEEGEARALLERSLGNGISVVTANKALLARHGYGLAVLAEKNGACMMYEGAVAGGIPIIKALREGFAANELKAVYGILNGTCNYILTEMRETGRSFADVLKEAQKKGYAEADPGFDVDGVDAAHKLCLLSALAFGVKPKFETLRKQGIRKVTAADIAHAHELGYRIKLLGISRRLDGRIVQTVEPCLVPEGSTMGAVEGVFNAVFVEGDFVDTGLAVGRGAGQGPTASAVVADIIDLARGYKTPAFGIPASVLADAQWGDPGEQVGRFYIHLTVIDQPGVLADVTAIMRDYKVSIEAVQQRGRDPENPVSVVIITHNTRQADINEAVGKMGALRAVAAEPSLLRIENF